MNQNNKLVACAYLNACMDGGIFDPTEMLKKVIIDVLHRNAGRKIGIIEIGSGITTSWGFGVPEATIAHHMRSPQIKDFWEKGTDQKFQIVSTSSAFDALDKEKRHAKDCIESASKAIARELILNRLNDQYTPNKILSSWLETGPLGIVGFDPSSFEPQIDPVVNAIIMKCGGVGGARNSEFLENLTTIAMGDVLYRALEISTAITRPNDSDEDKDAHSMSEVSIFLDTGLVSRILGFYLEDEEAISKSFIQLCRKTGANIYVFEHTLDEFNAVCSDGLRRSLTSTDSPMPRYLLEKSITTSEAALLISSARETLAGMGIKVVEKPSYGHENREFEPDFTALQNSISAGFGYRTADNDTRGTQADFYDSLSIRSIYVLRKGEPKTGLEKCNAIFVTNSFNLQQSVHRHMKDVFSSRGETNIVQLCMTEKLLATRLWLKLPTPYTGDAKIKVVQSALGSLKPPPKVKDRFFKYIADLVEQNKIDGGRQIEVALSMHAERALAAEYTLNKTGYEIAFPSILNGALQEINDKYNAAKLKGKAENKADLLALEADLLDLKREYTNNLEMLERENSERVRKLELQIQNDRMEIQSEEEKNIKVEEKFSNTGKWIRAIVNIIFVSGAVFLAELYPVLVKEEKFQIESFIIFSVICAVGLFYFSFQLDSEKTWIALHKWKQKRGKK
jgi:hypothetical protein